MVQLFLPHPALAPFVLNLVVANADFPEGVWHHVGARGMPMLIFPFSAPSHTSLKHGADGKAYPRPLLDAPAILSANSIYTQCYFEGTVRFVMVILHATGASHLLRDTLKGFVNEVHTLEDVGIYAPFAELQERLWDQHESAAAAALVQRYLLRYFLQRQPHTPHDFTPVIHHMIRTSGMASVKELSVKFNCSDRWLEKQCTEQTGMTPKSWLNIIRFRSMVNNLMRHSSQNWMDAVERFGYYDQSHMIHQFQRFAGLTPAQYFRRFADTERMLKQHEGGMSGLMSREG